MTSLNNHIHQVLSICAHIQDFSLFCNSLTYVLSICYSGIGPVKHKNNLRKIVISFLSISLNMCFGCSKEPSHRDTSFEYTQHMFWLRNKKNNFQLPTLIWRPE